MNSITIEYNVVPAKLDVLGVYDWPIWSKQASTFNWTYEQTETCYFLRGRVRVTPEGGEAVEMGEGDLVTFPAGMKCTWEIIEDVEKHYDMS
ncbi:MAG: cupin domain-containing protein [Gammaproteobacteria bacterium]|nr:MAG: cupin domain-containing protein [Gammaproteobacteria bacterium]